MTMAHPIAVTLRRSWCDAMLLSKLSSFSSCSIWEASKKAAGYAVTSKLMREIFVGAPKCSAALIAAACVAKSDHVMLAHSTATAWRCPSMQAMTVSALHVERG